MGVFDDVIRTLFGGSTQESRTDPVDLNPFTGLRSNVSGELTRLLQNRGGPEFEGPFVAPLGEREQSVLDILFQDAQQGERRDLLGQTLRGDFLPGRDAIGDEILQETIRAAQQPTLRGLEETLERTLPSRFALSGQTFSRAAPGGAGSPGQGRGSSAFDRAAAIATEGTAQQLSNIAAQLAGARLSEERQLQQQAVPLGQQEVQTTITNLQAQSLPRLIEDLGIERGLAEFQRRSSELLDILRLAGALTQPNISQRTVSEGETGANIVGTLLEPFSFSVGR